MKKNGMAFDTIRNVDKALSALTKKCDLSKPEVVKATIARFESNGYKRSLSYAYDKYAQYYGIKWEKPNYWQPRKIPKIPIEKHLECIIASAPTKTSTALAISKDTGLRPIELMNLTLKDIDLINGVIYPETAKHGQTRVLKIKKRTLSMLLAWIQKMNIKPNEKIFLGWKTDNYSKSFRFFINKVAKKLHDPSIRTIKLYHFRHFYATMLLKRTNNILIVKQKLGHTNINHTLLYTQILDIEDNDNYSCEIAENVEQARKLIENGFEYITEMYGVKLFRKRK
jgi:integrase